MIIFGSKTKSKAIGGKNTICPNCRIKTAHYLIKHTSWFTLYFMPILPLSDRLFVKCGRCGFETEIEDEDTQEKIYEKLKELKKKK